MKTIVAVLRGGPSEEYEVSLKSGAAVLEQLDRGKYQPLDIFISREGAWHRGGTPTTPTRALLGADVAFNVLHGRYGEDGSVQRLLEALGVKYTGSGVFASARAFNKHLTKESLAHLELPLPRSVLVSAEEAISERALELFRTFPMPAIVKPVAGGSSAGMTLARDLTSLERGIRLALKSAPHALVEEYIRGREATVGVIDGFRGEKTYALLPVEIVLPSNADFFDYAAKYGGETQELCPSNFSAAEKEILVNAAKRIHETLGLSHYSRSDFIVSRRGTYFLEVNPAAAVGLTKESLLPKALQAVGATQKDFLDHVVGLALGR